ncbi:hypothetical protein VPH35_061540 [Triticum aestivum]
MLEALASPLDFTTDDDALGLSPPPTPKWALPETLPTAMLPDVLPCIATPRAAATETQEVEAISMKVNHMQIKGSHGPQQLFSMVSAPILTTPKPPRTSAPPKSRVASAPSRRSARQAAANNPVSVSQRAALRIIQELGRLGPNDKMTPEAAAALVKRFDEPLSEAGIVMIARLTNLNIEALKIAADMLGPDGAANVAQYLIMLGAPSRLRRRLA